MKKQNKTGKVSVKILRKVEELETNDAILKVLYWFFAYPDIKIGLTELAKELGISKKSASTIVGNLVREKFLILEEIGRTWRISCNIQHLYNQIIKIGYNLNLAYKSGIVEKIHKKIGHAKAIVLFGSYRKGDDISSSDIDIAVEVVGNEELKIVELGILPQLGYRKNVHVNLHIFSRNKIDLNLFANIANGIVLEGFLEVRP